MKWDELIEEKVSKEHKQNVLRAAAKELKGTEKSSLPKWLLGLASGAVPLALALFISRRVSENDSGEPADEMMQAFLAEDVDELFDEPELLTDNEDLLENLDLMEDLDILENLPDDETLWEDV